MRKMLVLHELIVQFNCIFKQVNPLYTNKVRRKLNAINEKGD